MGLVVLVEIVLCAEGVGPVVRVGVLVLKGEGADAVRGALEGARAAGVVVFVVGAFGGDVEVGDVGGEFTRHEGGASLGVFFRVGAVVVASPGASGRGAVLVVLDGDDFWRGAFEGFEGTEVALAEVFGFRRVLDLVLGGSAEEVVLVHGYKDHSFSHAIRRVSPVV